MNLETLYKRNKNGSIQYWQIDVLDIMGGAASIAVEHGQVGTDSPQRTSEIIKEGKNASKINATSAFEQAVKEAHARWQKQVKKGYTPDLEKAKSGQDEVAGGVVPMLAHVFEDHGHEIVYPALAQPKLDGIRCIAVIKDAKATLWTRTRKPITSCTLDQSSLVY